MSTEIRIPKKLIEVALPLDAINLAVGREKSIRHGHPSTLHMWWARRPVGAARAVIFAQMVNDPGYERSLGRGVNKEKAQKERERLFKIIERLVLWENTQNETVLHEAKQEIWNSWRETCSLNKDHPDAAELFNPEKLPAFHDPFAGGGAIPLEAQRLGLESYASDLNPVAVMINKAMIEIPFRFQNQNPYGPVRTEEANVALLAKEWPGISGLAEDVRRYGAWIYSEAFKRVGHLYPSVTITSEMAKTRSDLTSLVGKEFPVIAWLWARTIHSPNPAYAHVAVPLVSTFMLSNKEGKEAFIETLVKDDKYHFRVRVGSPSDLTVAKAGTKLGRGSNFRCLVSGAPISGDYVKEEAQAGRMGVRLLATVAEGARGRIFLSPTEEMEQLANRAVTSWKPNLTISGTTQYLGVKPYGMEKFSQLFTDRQLAALSTFSDLIIEAHARIMADAVASPHSQDTRTFTDGGRGPRAYADAVSVYLSFILDRVVDRHSTVATWDSSPTKLQLRNTFSRQAIQMTWDFGEGNPFCNSSGTWLPSVEWVAKAISFLPGTANGVALQRDASTQELSRGRVVSTDPPYYDNVPYADLSDFYYVWLRRTLHPFFGELFQSEAVPKIEELVAFAYRHQGKAGAEAFFLNGMTKVMNRLAQQAHPAFPVTIYYAFKQAESDAEEGTASTGWETFLGAVLSAGFSISATWPMRTELGNRMRGMGSNALASSVVLSCRQRSKSAPSISRRDFLRELNLVLPEALADMTTGGDHSPVAPVDLSQAIIGPGMAIFSKYSAVLEADGKPMSVRTALQLINRFLAEDDFDHDTQFCLSWFEGHGWDRGKFGEADVLARAKGTSVDGLRDGGVVESASGNVRLLRPTELSEDWSVESDSRITVWELLHHMIRRLLADGETGAGEILAQSVRYAESIRTLAYRLYTLCERRGWAQDAGHYNALVLAWDAIESSAQSTGHSGAQTSLFGEDSAPTVTANAKTIIKKRTRKKT